MPEFDKDYWERQWAPSSSSDAQDMPVNPYLVKETAHLQPAAALDAGCGTGTESLWLAERGWTVTAADISATALAQARARVGNPDHAERIAWVEADLSQWQPDRQWDLVVTNYAHAQIGQLAFYRRVASWVAPGGTLLIVGHLNRHSHSLEEPATHDHPEDAAATLEGITNVLSAPEWDIKAAYEHTRTVHPSGSPLQLHDVVVRAQRLR